MVRNNKVQLGKKDAFLRNWWEKTVASGENVSKTVVCALEYYRLTGSFLTIGESNDISEKETPTTKYVYIPEQTELYAWLQERKEKGDKVAAIIKYVVRNSLIKAESVKVYSFDELFNALYALKINKNNSVVQQNTNYTPRIEQAPVITRNEVKTEPARKEYTNTTTTKPTIKDEPETERDIFSALLGDNGLDL